MVLPFSVFLRSGRPYYYVAFKNEQTGGYLPAISTKKTHEKDAIRQAWVWYRDGIPRKGGSLDLKRQIVRDTIKNSPLSKSDAEYIIGELQRRGLVKVCVFAEAFDSVRFSDYLTEFWDWQRSPYVKEKIRREHSIHRRYVKGMLSTVKQHWVPFFAGILLGEIVPGDIERFAEHLSSLPIGYARKNDIIKSGAVPLRWAFRKEKISQDVTRGLVLFSGKAEERNILTDETAAAIFKLDWPDIRAKAASMTAMVTGLRAGELQGLRVADLGDEYLTVCHSWNRQDKLKTTKNNDARIVEVTFPSVIDFLRDVASLNPHGVSPESYVFWAERSPDKPAEQNIFLKGLRAALVESGMSKEAAKDYVFHGWRHFYTTYMRYKIEDKLLQDQTGHKTLSMLERYSKHRLVGDRDKVRDVQREVFSALLPEK